MANNKKRRNKTRISAAQNKPKNTVSKAVTMNRVRVGGEREKAESKGSFEAYIPPAGVIPVKGKSVSLANDSGYSSVQGYLEDSFGYNTTFFKGYPHYANLYNMPEFRKIVEVMATEITRKWITLKSTDDTDVSDDIKIIEKELNRLHVQTKFSELISQNFIYGRGQLYINLKMPKGSGLALDDDDELKSPLIMKQSKIAKDGFVSLNIIEPIQTTAAELNTINALKENYYEPTAWYVSGSKVHADRIITLITNPVATYLKPAFNYGGLSLLQLVEPTINNWLTVRDSGKDLVKGSNVFALKTNMENILSDNGLTDEESAQSANNLTARAALFSRQRNSQGLMLLDYEKEELSNINVSMAGIAEMITKYQEQPSQVTGIPVVKLTGNTPSGLNASSEGEIKVFYDMITALKEAFIREPLKRVIDIIQISKLGEINESITFDFDPMEELTEKEQAEIEAIKTTSITNLFDASIITDYEAKEILKKSGNPAYTELENEIDDEEADEE